MADTASFELAVQNVLDQAKVTAGTSGLSWNSYGFLYEKLKSAAILAAFDLAIEGYQKKQLILDLLGKFIDEYLPLPGWTKFLPFLRPTIKGWIFWAADGAIESTFKLITKLAPQPVPVPVPTPAPKP